MTAPRPTPAGHPALRGAALALLAALLFGLSTPLLQWLGQGVGAFTTAALLYAGAALAALALRQPAHREARLLAMAACGAVVGPVALAWGLQRTSGASASLLLTLEALFTALLAWRLYGEALDRRVAAAMGLLLAGGLVLVLDQGQAGGAQLLGLLAVLLATAAWGADNALSRGVAWPNATRGRWCWPRPRWACWPRCCWRCWPVSAGRAGALHSACWPSARPATG